MAIERHIEAFEDQARTLASVSIDKMWERMRGEFLDRWNTLQRQGLSEGEMARELDAFIDGLSEKPEADLARTSSGVAYNQGRAAEILSDDEVQFVVRSEVLDSNTCAPCGQLDGAVIEVDSRAFQEFMPPAKCLGGDRCRGFYIPIRESDA